MHNCWWRFIKLSILHDGVPQGGILSPLLIFLYLNDMHYTSADINLFADDTSTYVLAVTAPQLQISLPIAYQ